MNRTSKLCSLLIDAIDKAGFYARKLCLYNIAVDVEIILVHNTLKRNKTASICMRLHQAVRMDQTVYDRTTQCKTKPDCL